MKTQERLTPIFVALLLTMGFSLHLANLGQYAQNGRTSLASITSPVMDAVMGGWMAFCAILLLFRWRAFFAAYALHGWKRGVYVMIAFYVTASLPGHAYYVATHNTAYFDLFPWWFSPVIMTVYVLLISFLLSLRAPVSSSGHSRSAFP